MRGWFGPRWRAGICATTPELPLPTACCFACTEPFHEGQRGVVLPFSPSFGVSEDVPYHLTCFMKQLGLDPTVVEDWPKAA